MVLAVTAPRLPAQNQTTFYAAFQDGQEAIRQQQWQAAIGALQRAVQLRPSPAARIIIYGNNLLADYYPYSLLARCKLELGDPDAAADWLRQAEVRGEPARIREPVARRLPVNGAPAAIPEPAAPHEPVPAQTDNPQPEPTPVPTVRAPLLESRADSRLQEETAPDLPEPNPPRPAPRIARPDPDDHPERSNPGPLESPRRPGPDPIRPLGFSFWLATAGGLVALAWGWKHRSGSGHRESPASPEVPAPAAGMVGAYQLVRILGHGGFATTYLARHASTGEEVALKVLHPHRGQSPEFSRRFSQEARLGAMLEHPHLVRLLDSSPPDQPGWIALEFVPGPTLEAYLRERGPVPLPEAVDIILPIAEAMAYAHARGVVHRDLKPANIIMSGRGPIVMDLGIAKDLDGIGMTTTYSFLGTPLYAAPETQHTTTTGPAADRYSLGVILFELIAGRPPYLGETPFAVLDQHRSAPVPDIQTFCPVPPTMERLLRRLLDKEPEQRPEDGELISKLQQIRNELGETS